jgi:fructose-bisphosphate aldolase class II
MPLIDMQDLLQHARRHGYAVGGFEPVSLDSIGAILQAAENTRSPVVLSLTDDPSSASYDFELAMAAAETAARRAGVPVAIELGHGASIESAVRAVRLGCNGVTLDAADETFPENVARTRAVVNMAHACGVPVEGTLRGGVADAEKHPGGATGASVEEAMTFIKRTGADFLALSLGPGSGRSRGVSRSDFERLKRLTHGIDLPLVIRGGAEFSEEQIRRLIAGGAAKIHCDGAVAGSADKYLRANARGGGAGWSGGVRGAIRAEVERCLRVFGSAGRAAEVLAQCRAWRPVEHVIVYNVEHVPDTQVEAMMARGREVLAAIPGVRRVVTGWAVADAPRYRFCWLIEFAHRAVIDSYREHPLHRQFADKLFRPIAGDRVSVDFEHVDAVPSTPVSTARERAAG